MCVEKKGGGFIEPSFVTDYASHGTFHHLKQAVTEAFGAKVPVVPAIFLAASDSRHFWDMTSCALTPAGPGGIGLIDLLVFDLPSPAHRLALAPPSHIYRFNPISLTSDEAKLCFRAWGGNGGTAHASRTAPSGGTLRYPPQMGKTSALGFVAWRKWLSSIAPS